MTDRDDIGRSLFTDYLGLQDELTEQELDYLERTRRFVDHEVLPVIGDYWQRAEFPFELIAKMAELGIVGDGIEGYGCPQMSPTASGLINMELSRGDGSLGTFLGVQSGLAMRSIALLGSETQKQRWLPGMAALEVIGAFALTEPEHGSDSVGLEASLHRDGDAYVLSGRKRWIGNGSIADVVVVWARDTEDGAVKGLLLEQGTPGFQAEVMQGKGSVRAVWQADLTFTDVRIPLENKLPGANTFKDAGGDAGRGHRDAAVLPTAGQAARGRQADRHDLGPGEDEQHPQGPRGHRDGQGSARWQRHPAGEPRDPAHGRHRGDLHLRGHRRHPDPHRRTGHHRYERLHLR